MIWSVIMAVGSAWLTGGLLVAALWPRDRGWREDLGLILPLALGLGLGVASALFFAASLATREPLRLCVTLEILTVCVAAGLLAWRRFRATPGRARAATSGFSGDAVTGWKPLVLGSLFAQAALLAIVVSIRAYHAEPYSNSDGWVIWNMHARFLFRGGEDWTALLRAPQIAWTHPDYPLLVPASVARAWTYIGHDEPAASGIISALFGVATVWLLVSAVARLRHTLVAITGGLLLLGTPFFVTFSSNQHADIPLAYYILAALALTALDAARSGRAGFSALAGAAAGLAAWTKNEGLLFVLVLGLVWGLRAVLRRSWRSLGAFVMGLAAALLPVVYFKFTLSPPNDIVSSEPWSRLAFLFDPSRHRLILSSLWRDAGRFGEWSLVPFAVMALPLAGRGWKRICAHEWLVAAAVGLTLAGYYMVYLLTHWDLAAHLDSSLVRLLLQLWPATLFFWCLAATYEPAQETVPPTPRTSPRFALAWPGRWAFVLLANVAVATLALALLGRQLAANELASGNISGARVRVLLGDGWFGREKLGDERWAWSRGESLLLVRVDEHEPPLVKLRFSIRSLGVRTVTASLGDRPLWHGAVRDEPQAVEIAGLAFPVGTTAITFHTDAPGVPESDALGARALTFAVYNPEVEK